MLGTSRGVRRWHVRARCALAHDHVCIALLSSGDTRPRRGGAAPAVASWLWLLPATATLKAQRREAAMPGKKHGLSLSADGSDAMTQALTERMARFEDASKRARASLAHSVKAFNSAEDARRDAEQAKREPERHVGGWEGSWRAMGRGSNSKRAQLQSITRTPCREPSRA